ncbi:MAG: universal stress protein, partial [Candidatus Hermodarchaeota archaeon]
MYKKVLLAVDGSEDAKRAAVRLIDLYEPGITKIVMFHSYAHHLVSRTISEITPSVYTIPGEDYTMIQLQFKKAGEKILNEIKKLFSNANIDVETRLISDEEP